MTRRPDALVWLRDLTRKIITPHDWGGLILLALVYFCSARLASLFAFQKTNASPFWPPAGIALAAFAILGRRAWVGVALGAFVSDLVTFIGNGLPSTWDAVLLSAVIGGGNAGAAPLAGSPRVDRASSAASANALDEDQAACLEAGMDAFLSKPIGLDGLRSTLARFSAPAAPDA